MRKRKLYTANEEFRGVTYSVLFTCIWFAGIIRFILHSGWDGTMLLFLLAGFALMIQTGRMIQKAMYYRRFAREVKANSRPMRGRIVNIMKQMQREYDGQRITRCNYYYIIVEITNPENGTSMRIRSEPYRIPVYKYLAEPYVDVYVDSTGWKYILDGFVLKKSKKEPDIPLEQSNVYLRDFVETPVILKVILLIIVFLFLLNILGVLR